MRKNNKNAKKISPRPIYKKPSTDRACDLKSLYEKENTEFARCMVDLANQGADIHKISKAIAQVPSKWKARTGTYDMEIDLSGVSLRHEKAFGNAIRLLTKGLKPVFPNCQIGQRVNIEIGKMQDELQAVLQPVLDKYRVVRKRYFDFKLLESSFEILKRGLPYKTDETATDADLHVITSLYPLEKIRAMCSKKKKRLEPAKQSTHSLWDECIFVIVNELKKINYSDRRSYIMTAKLLNLYYPKIYKDKDSAERVRQMYTYYRKTRLKKK